MRTLCPWASCDLGHAFLGFGVGAAPRDAGAVGALLFLLYESYRLKPLASKIIAGTQFGMGYLLAEALR